MVASFWQSSLLVFFLISHLINAQIRGRLFQCAWQVQESYERCNQGTIDTHARYTAYVSIPQHTVYRLKSPYPADGRYFVYTLYDTAGNTIINALPDFYITPSWGKNPYSDPTITGMYV